MSAKATARDVAEWMVIQLKEKRFLYQEFIVYEIPKLFGKEFTYDNASGNPAISKSVLTHFNKLTGDEVVWERREKMWRRREQYDQPGRMQP